MSRSLLTLVCAVAVAVGCAHVAFADSDRQARFFRSTTYYGIAGRGSAPEYRGKFVRVDSRSDDTSQSCERIGLKPSDDLTTRTFEDWHDLSSSSYEEISRGYLAAGIKKFRVYDLPYSYVDWMSRLDDDAPLTALALPASHIAGSSQPFSADESVQTQEYSIVFQLLLGVRVFDIRPIRADGEEGGRGRKDGKLWTYSPYQGTVLKNRVMTERLDRILNGVKMFLENYPTETVIFKVSDYASTTEDEVVAEIAAALGARFVNPSSVEAKLALRVADVRGKLLFLPIEHTETNAGPNGKTGTDQVSQLIAHLDKIPERRDVFNFFPASLKHQPTSTRTPEMMAFFDGMPALSKWLATSASDKVGIVETDYFGSFEIISKLIGQIVEKNKNLDYLRDIEYDDDDDDY